MNNNILLSKLPYQVIIAGAKVPINTDFRTSIKFEDLLNKYDLEDEKEQREFYNKALKLYYPILNIDFKNESDKVKMLFNHVIDNSSEAINKMMWFYRCAKELPKQKGEGKSAKEIYSYEHDADKIYSAFIDQYGIDLQEIEHLHWWKFKALFGALREDNEISRIMNIRAMDITKLPKEQKEHYRKLKKLYEIPKSKEEIKRNRNLAEILKRGGDLSELQE